MQTLIEIQKAIDEMEENNEYGSIKIKFCAGKITDWEVTINKKNLTTD